MKNIKVEIYSIFVSLEITVKRKYKYKCICIYIKLLSNFKYVKRILFKVAVDEQNSIIL